MIDPLSLMTYYKVRQIYDAVPLMSNMEQYQPLHMIVFEDLDK